MLADSGSFPVQRETGNNLKEWKRVVKQAGAGSDAGQVSVWKKHGRRGWVGWECSREHVETGMVRDQRGRGLTSRAAGHLRGDVSSVGLQEAERLPRSKEPGGGPSRMGGRGPSSGLDQGLRSSGHKELWLGV